MIDQQGRIYKGRNSHAPGSDADTITGQNAAGDGVTGAHAHGYNTGSVGVALLGTLTNQDATPAAKRRSKTSWRGKPTCTTSIRTARRRATPTSRGTVT